MHVLLFLLLCSVTSIWRVDTHQSLVDLHASKDAYVYFSDYECPVESCAHAQQNFGDREHILLSSYGVVTAGVVGFDLSRISNWNGESDTLTTVQAIFPPLSADSDSTSCTIECYPILSNWSELLITANTIPMIDKSQFLFLYDTITSSAITYATEVVKSMVEITNYDLSFYMYSEAKCTLPSRETGAPVVLRIEFSSEDVISCGDPTKTCTSDNDNCCVEVKHGSEIGISCYNGATHFCAEAYGSRRVCHKGLDVCNGECYDTMNYKCVNDRLCQKEQMC